MSYASEACTRRALRRHARPPEARNGMRKRARQCCERMRGARNGSLRVETRQVHWQLGQETKFLEFSQFVLLSHMDGAPTRGFGRPHLYFWNHPQLEPPLIMGNQFTPSPCAFWMVRLSDETKQWVPKGMLQGKPLLRESEACTIILPRRSTWRGQKRKLKANSGWATVLLKTCREGSPNPNPSP